MFSTRKGAAWLALICVVGLIAAKAIAAAFTGSLSITAQAADSFLDLVGIGVTLLAVRMAVMPADEEHPFGHGKMEGVAAAVQALLIVTTAGLIGFDAIRRIVTGAEIEAAEAGVGVMVFSVLVSFFLARHLRRVARETGSLSLEATARNITADIYAAAGVLAGMVAIRISGVGVIDPIIALIVAAIILRAAWAVVRGSLGELTDTSLPGGERRLIIRCIEEHQGLLAGYHAIRTRKSGSQRFIDLHLLMPRGSTVQEAHDLCDHLERDIEERLARANVTIHVEPCDGECVECDVAGCPRRRLAA